MRSFVRSYTGTQFPQSQEEGEKKSPETARDNALSSLFYVRAEKKCRAYYGGSQDGMEWTLLGLSSRSGAAGRWKARDSTKGNDKKAEGIVA